MHEVQRRGGALAVHHQPATLAAALELLDGLGDRARPIAGGTDLLLELARGGRDGIVALVDLTRIEALAGIAEDGDELVIGAATTGNQLLADPLVAEHALPLAQALLELGAPQLRNRATVTGNVVTASPANDTISALLALGTTVEIQHATTGARTVALDDFITGFRTVDLAPGELVTALQVRKLGWRRGVFAKLGLRKAQAISIVHGAVVLELAAGPKGTISDARVTLGSVAPMVVRCEAAEAALAGRPLDATTIAEAAAAAQASVRPIDDVRATAAYRSQAVEVLVRRSLEALRDGQERSQWPARPALLHGPSPAPTGRPVRAEHGPGDPIEATVNGRRVTVPGEPGQLLLDWLRDGAGLTGTKEGCAEGECGACTVLLDGQAVLACLVPAPRASGARITTVEGFGGDHPVQRAFVDHGGVQCGFCTPGFVVAAAELVDTVNDLRPEEIRRGLAGNLCRCTGYAGIVEAVAAVALRGDGRRPDGPRREGPEPAGQEPSW